MAGWISRVGRLAALAPVLLAGAGMSGCGVMEPVAPWQKGMLAQPAMRFDSSGAEGRFASHIYDSKEAASGAGSVGGGGCGCN